MAKKTTSKKVIDYDPLAWLDEPTETDPEETQPAASKPGRKKPAGKKSAQQTMAPAREPIKEESPGYGFFDEESAIATAQSSTQASTDNEPQEEAAAYGFFADDPVESLSEVVPTEATDGTIDLGAELTIRSIAKRKAMIDLALATGQDIRIDISQLQKIDSAGVQMIYSLLQTLQQTSQVVYWVGSNSMINDASSLLGMPSLIDDQQATEAFGFFAEEPDPGPDTTQEQDAGFGFF